jgi:hypothetical protein
MLEKLKRETAPAKPDAPAKKAKKKAAGGAP